jgi:hypothetical protein
MPAVVVRPTPESVRLDATTPAPRNRPEVAPEHLEVDAEISRDGEDSHASFEAYAGSATDCEDDIPHSSPKSSEARFGRHASPPHFHPYGVGAIPVGIQLMGLP